MALPGSGTITIDDLRTEFGATGTRGLADFYRGGAFVPDTPTNAGVPTSGTISLDDFYGASAVVDVSPAFTAFKPGFSSTSRTSTSLIADPHLFINSIPAGTYIFEGYFIVESASTLSPGNFRFQFTTPTTSASSLTFYGVPELISDTTTDPIRGNAGALSSLFSGINSTNVAGVDAQVAYSLHGTMISTATGNLTLTWGQNTSAPSNATRLFYGSWIKLWEVT